MLLQISMGSGLILLTIIVAGASFFLLEGQFERARPWLHREPHGPKQMLVLCLAMVWTLALVTFATWLWALVFWAVGAFPTLEASLYFSLVSFTTLGFGDVLLPQDWRLLAGMIAANGLISIGLTTAILVEVLRQLRLGQHEHQRQQRR
ncbi:MAG: potassium channel family protein [Rhodobacteraceae bacterium]|jgi:hypothetical protein|nr:potassium channel family protein [Paracoccaceae bacterium]